MTGRRRPSAGWLLLIPPALLLAALFVGRYGVSPGTVVDVLVGTGEASDVVRSLILRVRLPRALAAMCIGANLAASGAIFQTLFHNPLVDARILGVSSGAAFGAALALLASAGPVVTQWSALGFALIAIGLVVLVGWRYGASTLVLVVAGILVSALFSALLGLAKYVADPLDALPAITYWTLGSLSGVRWSDLPPLLVASGTILPLLILARWRLNLLALDAHGALALGVPIRTLRTAALLLATILVAVSVSVSGIIGWVGLIAPHIARAAVGVEHRRMLPAAISLGACAVLLLDGVARTALAAELPLGVLTGAVGVPGFLVVLGATLRRRGATR
ncbi:MAG: iron ABC transporter permease [Candidatus Bipolaricaulota bacterium]|nr:MAG: iron ABC transporter permease [Candidatus Bipolaricaulota bacterium]